MRKLTIGVLGAGPRAACILSTYAKVPFVEVVAICDRADGLAEALAKQYSEESGNKNVKILSYVDLLNKCQIKKSDIFLFFY